MYVHINAIMQGVCLHTFLVASWIKFGLYINKYENQHITNLTNRKQQDRLNEKSMY
jgi:hypothetical protein